MNYSSLVPKINIEAYSYLYAIETALRELIIDSLEKIAGPKWYKQRLPAEALQKYKDGKSYELSIKWTRLIPHHPIYYIDFTHIRQIIIRNDNWDDIFKGVFGRKSFIENTLSELEPIRNNIAHNRKLSIGDLKIVKTAYTKLEGALGSDRLIQLQKRCTSALDIYNRLKALQKECVLTYKLCSKYEAVKSLDIWVSVCVEWWFDASYLGKKLEGIIVYFNAIQEYTRIPRRRGTGHKIEAWVKKNDVKSKYQAAQIEFNNLFS